MPGQLTTQDLLNAAVEGFGGQQRAGQQQMAAEVECALADREHLLIQAGTGTGKSLGYLAPALSYLMAHDSRIIIATATLALQHQLANKDIPAALSALRSIGGVAPNFAVLKGRSNYACLVKVREAPLAQDSLFNLAESVASSGGSESSQLGTEVLMLREWAEQQLAEKSLADRDDAPAHTAAGWAQVSIPVRECIGAAKCPFGSECFVEKSREQARAAQLIITNHALLAIDAMHGGTALPEYDAVIIDEAHELVARITSAATNSLSPRMIERVGKRVTPFLTDEVVLDFLAAADNFRMALDQTDLGQITDDDSAVVAGLQLVRDSARAVVSGLAGDGEPEQQQAALAASEINEFARRMADLSAADVVWIADSEELGRQVHAAPLNVAGLMRERILADHVAVMTSATLSMGGNFEAVARSIGLSATDEQLRWRSVDVGSPFHYRKQGILYIAKHLSNPRREGISDQALAELAELVWAAGGRTLGLFASRRSAELATAYVRRELPKMDIHCQGDAQLSELTKRFIAHEKSCLFGTISLWQGVDVPGNTCQLVVIDKIPFPRPDDPLIQARQRAVAEAGGNGFMAVSATHAALLLAQGAGRLIRRVDDKGVVAVLDPRLSTARYGAYLRASLPDFWPTDDLEVAVAALRRLNPASIELE